MARIVAAACIIGVAVLTCAAQDAAATDPVRGVVLDRVSGQPIARVLVDANEDAVLTDNDGHFELNLPAGARQINLRRPGYGGRGRGAWHAVTVGANMPELTLYLTPDAIITGHVTLSTGDEADGIRVMAYRRRAVNGRERWTLQGMAITNSEGVFRLANLDAPASYLLYSMPSRDRVGAIAPGAVGYGYPSVYFPGVTDLSAAGELTLTPGQQAQADFALTRQPFYSVTITVANNSEGHLVPMQIHDTSGRVMEMGVRWNAEQEAAQVNLPSGHYYAEARSGREYGRVDFAVAAGPVSGLSMALLPLHSIPVEVHKDFTAGANGTTQGVVFSDSEASNEFSAGLNLTLAPADAFDQGNGGRLRRADGASDSSSFELEDVAPGQYWVQAQPFQGYVSSITSGGVDLAREPLVVGPGSSSAPVEVTLRNDVGSISGELNQSTAATPVSGAVSSAHIYAIPMFPTTGRVPQAMTQSSGTFSIPNLAPGSYHVIALNESEEIDPSDPQELAKFTGKGQTVTVEANGTANVQLDVMGSSDEGSTP